MSSQAYMKRTTVTKIVARKGKDPIICLTAYHAPMARLLDPHVDLLLVGDSLGMVLYGMETTLGVTLEHMIMHGQAVSRGARQALVVVDMPFGTYEESPEVAFRNASRIIRETGCMAVKIEGGARMAKTIAFLVERGVPVMAHIGLLPQSIHTKGGYRVVGRDRADWPPIEADAQAVAEAGAFAVVLEGMAAPLAARITKQVAIPTIGIGASNQCDGQILVTEDMLGMTERVPSFVKIYANLEAGITEAAKSYAQDVRARAFPSASHAYAMKNGPRLVSK